MRVSNLAGIVLSAGAISLFAAQPAKAQEPDLETRVKSTQEIALTQPQQEEVKDYPAFFSDLCKKIRDWEFYYENLEKKDRYWHVGMNKGRREIARNINNDMRKLLARYGADFAFESVSDSYAFSIADGFVVKFYLNGYPGGSGTITFRNNDVATIDFKYYGSGDGQFKNRNYSVKLKPTKGPLKPLDDFLGVMRQDDGKQIFALDDFDEAYKLIREVDREQGNLPTRDFKYDTLLFTKMGIIWELKQIHGLNDYWYGREVYASSGRILLQLEGEDKDGRKANFDLVIFPNKTTLTTNYSDSTFKIDPLPQVMRSYGR